MKETLKNMKHTLIAQTSPSVANLQCADYEELGAAIDMIKDLEEALYYCTIIEAMEEKPAAEEMRMAPANNTYYYTERYLPVYNDYYRDMDKERYGRMYYNSGNGQNQGGSANMSSSSGTSGMQHYNEYPMEMIRDKREGRSPMSRRMYMESKEMHADKSKQLKDLENYMQELTSDISEMIKDASPEEKQLLQKKISALSMQVEQMK